MSTRDLSVRITSKLAGLVQQGVEKVRWLPTYLHFQGRGHGGAWRIFTHLTEEERLLLYSLGLKQSPGAVFVEIGSYLGASACFLAAATSAIGLGAMLHCVDTWQNDAMPEGTRDTWEEFQANTFRYAPVIVSHRGRSVEVARTFGEPIDLLFLDGDHSYDGFRADVEAWMPLVKSGGVLIIHDYGWAEDVQRVVREMVLPRQCEPGRVLQNTYWARL